MSVLLMLLSTKLDKVKLKVALRIYIKTKGYDLTIMITWARNITLN